MFDRRVVQAPDIEGDEGHHRAVAQRALQGEIRQQVGARHLEPCFVDDDEAVE